MKPEEQNPNPSQNPFHPPAGDSAPVALSVQLDAQASAIVRGYCEATGARPEDVVNGAVTSDVAFSLEQIRRDYIADDGPGVTAAHVAAARRRRLGEEEPFAPVVLPPLPPEEVGASGDHHPAAAGEHSPRFPVTLELGAEAFAMLELIRCREGHASAEEAIRCALAGTFSAHAEGMSSDADGVREAFGLALESEGGAA